MITSKHIFKVLEVYKDAGTSQGHRIEIYENPSSSDWLALAKSAKDDGRYFNFIRFLPNAKTKKVYVADGFISMHADMRKILGFPPGFPTDLKASWTFDGLARTYQGATKMTDWNEKSFLRERVPSFRLWFEGVFKYNWSFVDYYIPGCSSLMKIYQKEFESIKV